MSVGALEPKFWMALNSALGRKGSLAELVAPADKQAQVADELSAIFATKTRAEWTEVMAGHDCCCEPIYELYELGDMPLHESRGMFFKLDGDGDSGVRQMRTPVGAPRARNPAPTLGQHSAEVLAEFGFSETEIAELAG